MRAIRAGLAGVSVVTVAMLLASAGQASEPAARSKAETETAIFARQQTMSQLAKDAELLGQIVAGLAPADKLAATTDAIARGASDAVSDFAEPIPGGHTKAEAWSSNADFTRRMQDFARNAAVMAKAGKSGDVGAVTGLMIDGLPCKQCHDLYRERKQPGS